MYKASVQVKLKAVEENMRILNEWSAYGISITVEWIFTSRKDNSTFVSIANTGFSANGDEVLRQVIDSTAGFAQEFSQLKALLEHHIDLNLIADGFPAESPPQ